MKNLTIREFAFFSLVAALDEFLSCLTKRAEKRYICDLKKSIPLVYNIIYYLIVPIDRAP